MPAFQEMENILIIVNKYKKKSITMLYRTHIWYDNKQTCTKIIGSNWDVLSEKNITCPFDG
jgi:hypothetical protein